VAPEYVPPGTSLPNTVVLEPRAGDSDALLDAAVREQLGPWYGIHASAGLELIGIDRIPFAQFTQPPFATHGPPSPDTALPNVVIASDALRFSSIQGAMEAGEQAAATILGDATVLARPVGA
jgi:hypothetical protein